ncbi:hypothetical protein BdWA1_002829 [Babesia duncani]|uniref:Uncharacterized protein n=1 Tax=Babesia duncani TaxID=323732 RepID=A0AAD9PJY2_9APIC|nr:hypothetical protein BdWA1_002829 [Babesia duncani]
MILGIVPALASPMEPPVIENLDSTSTVPLLSSQNENSLTLDQLMDKDTLCAQQRLLARYLDSEIPDFKTMSSNFINYRYTLNSLHNCNVLRKHEGDMSLCKVVPGERVECEIEGERNLATMIKEYLTINVCTCEAALNFALFIIGSVDFTTNDLMTRRLGLLVSLTKTNDPGAVNDYKEAAALLRELEPFFRDAETALRSKELQKVLYDRILVIQTILCAIGSGVTNPISQATSVESDEAALVTGNFKTLLEEAVSAFHEAYKPLGVLIDKVTSDEIFDKLFLLSRRALERQVKIAQDKIQQRAVNPPPPPKQQSVDKKPLEEPSNKPESTKAAPKGSLKFLNAVANIAGKSHLVNTPLYTSLDQELESLESKFERLMKMTNFVEDTIQSRRRDYARQIGEELLTFNIFHFKKSEESKPDVTKIRIPEYFVNKLLAHPHSIIRTLYEVIDSALPVAMVVSDPDGRVHDFYDPLLKEITQYDRWVNLTSSDYRFPPDIRGRNTGKKIPFALKNDENGKDFVCEAPKFMDIRRLVGVRKSMAHRSIRNGVSMKSLLITGLSDDTDSALLANPKLAKGPTRDILERPDAPLARKTSRNEIISGLIGTFIIIYTECSNAPWS